MAPVIFGLNLGDMHWGNFKSSYMFKNTDYHLRRTKFIVYQLAMIFCVVSESLGTAALSDYIDQQKYVETQHPGVGAEYNDDYVGIGSYNIFAGIYVAFVFGGAFFFDLFFPERREDRGIRLAWRACSVASCIFVLGDVIAMTVIVSSKSASITGVTDPTEIERLVSIKAGSTLLYRQNPRALASLVFLWLGFPCVIASTVIMWLSLRHDERQGPLTTHAQNERDQTRRDVEAAGGSFELPGKRNIDGYSDARKSHEKPDESSNSSSPSDAHTRRHSNSISRPSGERTYTGT